MTETVYCMRKMKQIEAACCTFSKSQFGQKCTLYATHFLRIFLKTGRNTNAKNIIKFMDPIATMLLLKENDPKNTLPLSTFVFTPSGTCLKV